MQAASSAHGSPSGGQPVAENALNQPNASASTQEAPLFQPVQLIEAMLKFQGSGFLALPETKALRLVSKGTKTFVDRYALFGLKLEVKVSGKLQESSHFLPIIQKIAFPAYNTQVLIAHDRFYLDRINPALKSLSVNSVDCCLIQYLLPRLNALTELRIGARAHSSGNHLSRSFAALRDKENLSTLKTLIIASREDITPEICDLARSAWSNLVNLEELDIRWTSMGLDKAPFVFTNDDLPKLKHLTLRGDFYGSDTYFPGDDSEDDDSEDEETEAEVDPRKKLLRNGLSPKFTTDMLPEWPELESLCVSCLGLGWLFETVTEAPWFPKLKKLTIWNLLSSKYFCQTPELLCNAGQLEELEIHFVGLIWPGFTNLRFPRLKKLELVKTDWAMDCMKGGYTPININSSFPALRTFRMHVVGAVIDDLIDLSPSAAPPSSSVLKSFALEGTVADAALRTSIYTQWMPRMEAAKIRFGDIQQMFDMAAFLNEQGAAAAPLWPKLSNLTLTLESGYNNCPERSDIASCLEAVASVGSHFPLLEHFTFSTSWEAAIGGKEDPDFLRPLLRATKEGLWPQMKKIVHDFEAGMRDRETGLENIWLWKGKEYSIEQIMEIDG